jgi:hypothetical protein
LFHQNSAFSLQAYFQIIIIFHWIKNSLGRNSKQADLRLGNFEGTTLNTDIPCPDIRIAPYVGGADSFFLKGKIQIVRH